MDCSQRFLCPSTPQSSPLSIGLRTRKRSRTSLPGGNSFALHKELEKRGSDSGAETKAHHSKCRLRLLPGNLKNQQKHPKANNASKLRAGNLQNAVVLAPFHTLKKAFQTKLINFYSVEKVKKMTYKTKTAKEQNMSFEYDIIELKPQVFTVKKEGKATNKSNEKTKPSSYCQCNKTREKSDKKRRENCAKLKRKQGGAAPLSRHLQTKRRKPNAKVVTPTALKAEFGRDQNFFIPKGQSLMSDPYLSSSAVSSRSKGDSWETYSNCPSSKEEYMEGALAISTTSFDCYSDNFNKDGWDFNETSRKCGKPEKNPKIPDSDGDLIDKPHSHLIMHVERKSSDGQILDFMDREPQTQIISSEESHQHLQPLRRQSRAKAKKPESESGCSCHPRAHFSNKARASRDTSKASSREWRSLCENSFPRSKDLQIEVATQVEGDILEEGVISSQNLKSSQRQVPHSAPVAGCERADIPRDKTPKGHHPCGSNSSLSEAKAKSLLENIHKESEGGPVDKDSSDREANEESGRESSKLEDHFDELFQRPTTPKEP